MEQQAFFGFVCLARAGFFFQMFSSSLIMNDHNLCKYLAVLWSILVFVVRFLSHKKSAQYFSLVSRQIYPRYCIQPIFSLETLGPGCSTTRTYFCGTAIF